MARYALRMPPDQDPKHMGVVRWWIFQTHRQDGCVSMALGYYMEERYPGRGMSETPRLLTPEEAREQWIAGVRLGGVRETDPKTVSEFYLTKETTDGRIAQRTP